MLLLQTPVHTGRRRQRTLAQRGRTAQTLVDLLKHPLCIKESRRIILAELSRHCDRPFADQWDFARFAAERRLGLDLTSPPPEK